MKPDSDSHPQTEPQELREALYLNKLILESAGEGIYGLDAEGKTTFINRAAEKLSGWKSEELSGRPVTKLFQDKEDEKLAAEGIKKYSLFSRFYRCSRWHHSGSHRSLWW